MKLKKLATNNLVNEEFKKEALVKPEAAKHMAMIMAVISAKLKGAVNSTRIRQIIHNARQEANKMFKS